MPAKIMVTHDVMQKAESFIKDSKKIQAIKLIRDQGRLLDDPSAGIRLKHAKQAVDRLAGWRPVIGDSDCAELVLNWHVHSVIVSGPAGNKIELDIENLQMHFLTSLTELGLREVAHLTDLVEYVKQWQLGAHEKNSEEEKIDD